VYREINNFYTATVYEKGAEVVRMLTHLLGPENFRKGMNLYFARHDGEAATIEQFVQCFADVSGADLTQFMRWYSQAGTPEVVATGRYDARAKTYRLDLAQSVPATPRARRTRPGGRSPAARVPSAAGGGGSRSGWGMGAKPGGACCFAPGLPTPSCSPMSANRRSSRSIADFPRRSSSAPTLAPMICDSSPRTMPIRSIAGKRCRRWPLACSSTIPPPCARTARRGKIRVSSLRWARFSPMGHSNLPLSRLR